MARWKGIVGRGFTAEQLRDYATTVSFGDWRPSFVVVHNTQVPRFSEWHKIAGERRMQGLERFYRDEMRWSGGPHLFVADDVIWVFTPLTSSGVHTPSWNAISWGVEVVGDYDSEPLTPAVRRNLVSALATLHALGGLDPRTIRLHKDDPRTSHTFCPGRNLASQRDAIVEEVVSELRARQAAAPGAQPSAGIPAGG